jgi:signal transduction histidine kinase
MLGEQARLACERHLRSPLARIDFDLALDEAPLPVSCSPLLLSELIRQLLESAIEGIGEGWGTVTVISGRTEAGRGHVSKAYPLVARSPELARATWHFLEIHDSGTALDPMEPGAALDTDDRDSRRRRLAVTSELARLLGGALGIDSAPGCGTQALLLLPPAPRTASE